MTEYILYGGKGGVGKTTCAAATGLSLAHQGTDTLVVSTDPAHSLSDAFETELSTDPQEVHDHLWAVEIDPEERLDDYQGMFTALADDLSDVGIQLDEGDVEELFASGVAPGSDEAAALDILIDYVDTDTWEYIILDTAPTGHTLRLLDFPDVLSTALEKTVSVRDQVRRKADSARQLMLGPAYYATGGSNRSDDEYDDFTALKHRMEQVDDLLRDADRTEFRVVLVPEMMAVRESERLIEQLRTFDVPVETVVLNKVLEDINEDCDRCRTRRDTQQERIENVHQRFDDLDIQQLPQLDREVHGLDTLESIAGRLSA